MRYDSIVATCCTTPVVCAYFGRAEFQEVVLAAIFAWDGLLGCHVRGIVFEFNGKIQWDFGMKVSDLCGCDLDLDIVALGWE